MWLHEFEVPVFGSLAINSLNGNGMYIFIRLMSMLLLFVIFESSFMKLSLYNVLYICLLIFCTVLNCSYLLLSGWSCSCIGFKWIHSLEGTFFFCHLIVTFMLFLYYYPYFDTYVWMICLIHLLFFKNRLALELYQCQNVCHISQIQLKHASNLRSSINFLLKLGSLLTLPLGSQTMRWDM